ncbi:MAG TPA: hypothetical protein VGH36_04250 [Acetobacteraceae bacterium]
MPIRTIARLYDSYGEAQAVVSDLYRLGVSADDVSFVANDSEGRYAAPEPAASGATAAVTGAGIGVVLGGGAGLLAGIGALTIPGIGPAVAAGWLVSMLAGAGVIGVAGGLLGSLVGTGLPEDEAHVYTNGVRRGGAVVAVRAEETRLPQIAAVLVERDSDWKNRSTEYRGGSWDKFDEHAPPYMAEPDEQIYAPPR